MSTSYSFDELTKKLRSDVVGRWHDEGRVGNDGSAGNTLEDLLGIEENNLKLPDWGNIELKTKRHESSALVTLLHREPLPAKSVPKVLLALGWKHQKAGGVYPADEKSFRSTTRANNYSDRGFAIFLTDSRIEFRFDPSKVSASSIDRTGNYPTYGDWLADVEARYPSYKDILPLYWERDYIVNEIRNKLDNTLLCIYKTRKSKDGKRQFFYESATLLSSFIPSKLEQLFNKQELYVDFDARTGHNHGTKFRVKLRSLPALFDKAKDIF